MRSQACANSRSHISRDLYVVGIRTADAAELPADEAAAERCRRGTRRRPRSSSATRRSSSSSTRSSSPSVSATNAPCCARRPTHRLDLVDDELADELVRRHDGERGARAPAAPLSIVNRRSERAGRGSRSVRRSPPAHSTSRSSSSRKCALGVGQHERDAAGPQHAPHLGDRRGAIGHVVEHVHRERDVEASRRRTAAPARRSRATGRRRPRARALRSIPADRSAPHTRPRCPRARSVAEVQAVAAADVEDRLVAAQRGEIERAVPEVDDAAAGTRRSTGAPRDCGRRRTAART